MKVLTQSSTRAYPLPTLEPDPRFSVTLVHVVADVLQHHGYPQINEGDDLNALAGALHGFLYRVVAEPVSLGAPTA